MPSPFYVTCGLGSPTTSSAHGQLFWPRGACLESLQQPGCFFALVQNGADLEKGWWSEPLRHAWPDKQDCARVWGQGRQS